LSTTDLSIDALIARRDKAALQIQTLGLFQVWRDGEPIPQKEWGRDKTVQLFQFLITARHRRGLHKEQIIDRLWEDDSPKAGEQNFKVAMHGINKTLEPDRKSRTEPRFVIRQGLAYSLNQTEIWIDADAVEQFIEIGNLAYSDDPALAIKAYRQAIHLYEGIYFPNRIYEDWSSEERERLQVLALGAITALSELMLEENPMESIRLAQQALQVDNTWEDAYRIQMKAYWKKGNRPMAIKTFNKCVDVLELEYGIDPLPETRNLAEQIRKS